MLSKAKQEHKPTDLYSKGTGKNACRYLTPWRYAPLRECSRGRRGGENRYFLRNEANKPFGINKNAWEEVQKATRKRNEIR